VYIDCSELQCQPHMNQSDLRTISRYLTVLCHIDSQQTLSCNLTFTFGSAFVTGSIISIQLLYMNVWVKCSLS
jgi:hypothetical protein